MILPLRNNIIILGLRDPDTWYGSAILRPESTKDRVDQGIVKIIGPEVKDIRIGDHVTFSPYAGKVLNVTDEGDTAIMISEDGVDSILTPPTTVVDGLYAKDASGNLLPITAEAALQVIRAATEALPRYAELKKKWHLAKIKE